VAKFFGDVGQSTVVKGKSLPEVLSFGNVSPEADFINVQIS
jgi:hypothetical protein